jgi:hypothetical protein
MRPMRLVLALLSVLLAPAASFAGKVVVLDGPFFFVDQKSFDKLTSLSNIDQTFQEYCLSGLAVFVDATTTLNRRVEIAFSSLGSIDQQNDHKVQGLFPSVTLTLNVYAGPENTADFLFTGTIVDADCRLDGSLLQTGAADRVTMACNVGPDFADFDIPATVPDPFGGPDITRQSLLDSITFATAKKKTISVKTKTGKININHVGVPNPNSGTSFLVCPTSSDIE